MVSLLVHCLQEWIVSLWLINWKLHCLEWKTCSFVLKFSRQNAENSILRALKFPTFLTFLRLTRPDPPPPVQKETNGPFFIQSVTLFKPENRILRFLLKPLETFIQNEHYQLLCLLKGPTDGNAMYSDVSNVFASCFTEKISRIFNRL